MILPITLTIAGAAAILHVWLSLRVSRLRRPLKIGVGDGGNEVLARRMRAHGNFAENMPIFLVLLGFLELATGGNLWLWGAAILFILARIAPCLRHGPAGRQPAARRRHRVSWLVLLGLGGYAILIAYQSPPIQRGFEIGPGRSVARCLPKARCFASAGSSIGWPASARRLPGPPVTIARADAGRAAKGAVDADGEVAAAADRRSADATGWRLPGRSAPQLDALPARRTAHISATPRDRSR